MPVRLPPHRQHGFTLVEIAMVLMILGLLLGGMLVPLGAQMEQQKVSETEKQLADAREALIGYAMANGRLPCPADPSIPTGQANAGIARTPPCTGNNSAGVLPWATLGIGETDAWGNRFTYRVSSDFADAIGSATYGGCTPTPLPPQASFALCSSGNLDVLSAAAGGTTVATKVPAVIISHGKNGAGSYTQQGTQQPVSGNADERENSDGSANNNYVSHTATPDYDDLVTWISNNILLNRMVEAGKLP
ncbi:MAG TPA: prepilin-type N-terminal cleavage/methylation domain-containing protein [Gallionella sp.]|nr:prepilin-type N-terminal cleavage/methylation domain-containing protein [Gallionella sp.]